MVVPPLADFMITVANETLLTSAYNHGPGRFTIPTLNIDTAPRMVHTAILIQPIFI